MPDLNPRLRYDFSTLPVPDWLDFNRLALRFAFLIDTNILLTGKLACLTMLNFDKGTIPIVSILLRVLTSLDWRGVLCFYILGFLLGCDLCGYQRLLVVYENRPNDIDCLF